jgi:uncharacterized membrane protein
MDPYLIVIIITILPWIELRGAIPVGILVLGLNPLLVFVLSVVVNILVFFPIFLGLTRSYLYLQRFGLIEKMVNAARKKGEGTVKKYGFWGLAIFVAIPLPLTGAWTGTLIAWLFNLERKRAFTAIALGVLIAGVIVTLFSLFAVELLYWLGVPRASPI